MSNEITYVGSMGYPDEIFEVTKDLTANCQLPTHKGIDPRCRRQDRRDVRLTTAGLQITRSESPS
ncbi:Sorbitol dehydrogenase [Mycolicibacterium fortuitum]|uniref:Sorbitol dehydrogenase n=1 Tax=Mycolicibacterium fortuitum TaxID=1766 RepID=A0A0N9YDC5_MYCFO|nr:Sorbitol dehydrogenase [Mycolicibacterium fortuitum]